MHIVVFSDNYRSKNVCHRLQFMFESRVWFMSVLILAMSVPGKRKRSDRSVDDQLAILKRYDELYSSKTQVEAASGLGIPQSTLSKILKRRESLKNDSIASVNDGRKRKRLGHFTSVDDALLIWFKQAAAMKAPMNRDILKDKARTFAQEVGIDDFSASDGWLSRWKERNGIVFKKLHGEKEDCDVAGAESWFEKKWPDISERYAPQDIFNTDETGLYYRATPDHCLIFKNSTSTAGKKIKDRLTVLLTCNMTGSEKLRPFVLGKSKKPRCFKGVNKLPVEYDSNSNAWMTGKIFENFLHEWDKKLRRERRKIALLLDNCPAHPPDLALKNIELVFLPPNTTALIQPLDQGIIKTFKTFYRSDFRRLIVQAIDERKCSSSEIAKKVSVLEAIHMIRNAWNKVSSTCIQNCFRKCKLIPQSSLESSQEDEIDPDSTLTPPEMTETEFNEWLSIDDDLSVIQPLSDGDIIAEIQNATRENESDSDDESDGEENVLVSKKQTMDALKTVRSALEQRGGSDEDYDSLYRIQNFFFNSYLGNAKQMKIDDFFRDL